MSEDIDRIVALTFRPFAMLTRKELIAEEKHWARLMDNPANPTATIAVASRHRERCLLFLRETPVRARIIEGGANVHR